MTKRITATLFVLLATIVLLAHAVIPHHHHQNEICFEYSNCECDHDGENQEHKDHKSHNVPHDFQDCILNQVVILPSNEINCEDVCFNLIDQYSDGLNASLMDSEYIKNIPSDFIEQFTPLLSSLQSSIIAYNSGLRAPPVYTKQ